MTYYGTVCALSSMVANAFQAVCAEVTRKYPVLSTPVFQKVTGFVKHGILDLTCA